MASHGFRLDKTCATPGCNAPRDIALTFRLLFLLPSLALAMKLFGFRRPYSVLERRTGRRVPPPSDGLDGGREGGRLVPGDDGYLSVPEHMTAVVIHVSRHVLPYQSKCLLESLTLWYLLRRRGFDAELYLGARTLLGPFEAHAWVELDGRVLNDAPNVRDIYEPFELASTPATSESP